MTRAKLLVTICQIEWSRSLEYASVIGHAQGKGVGSALMKALIDYADNWTTFLRIELTVYADNTNAIALYKKFGFEQEGLLRHYGLRSGSFDDVITMARFNKNQAVVQ
jgi:putative acetyltransferase